MATAGPLTSAQLKQYLLRNESRKDRLERLFIPFGGRRAELLNQLTDVVIAFITKEQNLLKGATVLDYGCGVQPYRLGFDLAGANVVGVDIGKNIDAQVQITDKCKLPFANDSFDYIVSYQVLEHVLIPNNYLSECYRVLKTGGKILLTTHGIWPYHPTPGDYHRWTLEGLIYEIDRSGFRYLSNDWILNEYSAFIQCFAMNLDYNKKLIKFKNIYHFITHVLIKISESCSHKPPQIPAIITIIGDK